MLSNWASILVIIYPCAFMILNKWSHLMAAMFPTENSDDFQLTQFCYLMSDFQNKFSKLNSFLIYFDWDILMMKCAFPFNTDFLNLNIRSVPIKNIMLFYCSVVYFMLLLYSNSLSSKYLIYHFYVLCILSANTFHITHTCICRLIW